MTTVQMGITIAVCTAATMLTRFLPFLIFSSKDQDPPEVVRYLGRVLPAAIFGMLIVYCLRNVTPLSGSHGIPEAIAIAVTVALHKWKHQTLVSIAGGTVCYVLLVQMVFAG
jgi:branched-subunit amino acid transport protein AzlD